MEDSSDNRIDVVVFDPEMVKPEGVIYLEKDAETELPYVVCTCGNFKTEPERNLLLLMIAAAGHRDDTGHILRQHEEES